MSSAARVSIREFFDVLSPRLYLILVIPRILLQVLFFYLVASLAGGKQLGLYSLVGNAFAISASSILVALNNLVTEERRRGTLEAIVMSPAPVVPVILGKCSMALLEGLFRSAVTLFIMGPIVGLSLHQLLLAVEAFPIAIIINISLMGLGFLIGSTAITNTRLNFLPNFTTYLLMILAGVNYPVSLLPQWARVLANFLPMTHGIAGFRAILEEGRWAGALQPFALEALVAVAYLMIGCLIFYRKVKSAREGVSDFV
ncbi:MAG: ABC transporter permease [Bacillota bacterium]|nr:ABC transporter permease [Bacillota bacterium]